MSFLTLRFSTIASIRRSQSAMSSRLVVEAIRFHAASRSAAESFPFSTALPSEPSMRAKPFFTSSSVTSRTTVS